MAIKKTELYSSLWASADELRGGMDAGEYKNYVLTLLFMKYVTDKYENDPYSNIKIPKGASFNDMVTLVGDKEIGDKINIIISTFAEKNELKGVIDTADFNDHTKLGSDKEMIDRLSKLIKIFNSLDLGANTAEGDDLLGDAYEYLMRHFATESGKSKGQFYTPSEVSTIIPKIIGIDKNTSQEKTIYDPTCGSGSLLIKGANEAPRGLSIYGQEKDVSTTALCRMNMILHKYESPNIAQGGQSTLAKPTFIENDTELKRFDFVVANPPFSLKAWTNGVDLPDKFKRFDGFEVPPEKNGDYAFLLHIVSSLKSSGKGAVILPHGVLFRGNVEGSIRAKLIKKGYIKGIIGLPPNLFYGTGIPACIIVLDKENASHRKSIFMIDASRGFRKDGNKNRLRSQDIHKIVDTFNKEAEIPKYSKIVSLNEIEANEYNLNIPRYIDSSQEDDIHDLYAHLNGGIPNSDIEKLASYWEVLPTLKSVLFTPSLKDYSTPNIEANEVKSVILNNSEFIEFKRETLNIYTSWKEKYTSKLYELDKEFNPKELISELSEDLLNFYFNIKLIDKYDIYQILMDYWAEIMQDDCYILSIDGWLEGAKLRELIPTKDKKNKNVYREAHDFEVKKVRYVADLIPPAYIIKKYFSKEQSEIDKLQLHLDSISSELESFKEENLGEDGLLEEAKSDKGNISKATITSRLKVTEDNQEIEALTKCKELIESEALAKKILKEEKEALDLMVYKKYPTLSIDEIKTLVIEDKWHNYLREAIIAEIERVTINLANRVKILEERYKEPLPKLEQEFSEIDTIVKKHLENMGLKW